MTIKEDKIFRCANIYGALYSLEFLDLILRTLNSELITSFKRNPTMILRNLEHPEVKATRYQAHGVGVAHMILDTRHLQTLMFLAHASLAPGKKLISHEDPMEEIYIIQNGCGRMQVGDEICEVISGDAVHIPIGHFHELTNTGEEELTILVVAGLIPA
jgi:mannose-6-phosphate isomerase-like protein (cupin superfamily)